MRLLRGRKCKPVLGSGDKKRRGPRTGSALRRMMEIGKHLKDKLFVMNYSAIILSKLVGVVCNDVHVYERQVLEKIKIKKKDWILPALCPCLRRTSLLDSPGATWWLLLE